MPTATIIYTTADGTRFDTEEEAKAHEVLVAKINAAMAPLGETPEAVEDGKGWLQHRPANVAKAKSTLCKLIAPQLEADWPHLAKAMRQTPQEVHPMSLVGRILSDFGGPLNNAWGRFGRIDGQGREHQQSYFALNGPGKEHVCVEDRR